MIRAGLTVYLPVIFGSQNSNKPIIGLVSTSVQLVSFQSKHIFIFSIHNRRRKLIIHDNIDFDNN